MIHVQFQLFFLKKLIIKYIGFIWKKHIIFFLPTRTHINKTDQLISLKKEKKVIEIRERDINRESHRT
jgi:hypothetical protein